MRGQVTLRDLAAVSGQVTVTNTDSVVSGVAHFFGMETAEAVHEAETASFVRSVLFVLFLGPVLSVVVVWAKGVALRAYSRAGGRSVRPVLLQ